MTTTNATQTTTHRDAVSEALYAALVVAGLTPYPADLPLGYKGDVGSADHWMRAYHGKTNRLENLTGTGGHADGVAREVLARAAQHQSERGVNPGAYEAAYSEALARLNAEIEARLAETADDSAW